MQTHLQILGELSDMVNSEYSSDFYDQMERHIKELHAKNLELLNDSLFKSHQISNPKARIKIEAKLQHEIELENKGYDFMMRNTIEIRKKEGK